MKRINLQWLIPVFIICLFKPDFAHGQSFSDPVTYMNAIDGQIRTTMEDHWEYMNSIARGKNARKVESKRKELLANTMNSSKKIGAMPSYKGDTALRDSVVAYLKLSYNVLNEDYAKIMNMEEVAEQSYDLMEAYLLAQEIANQKIENASEMVHDEFMRFGSDNGILINEQEDDLAKRLNVAGEVMDYYNILYLLFFKTYKQEAYLIEAMNKADISALEQNKNALVKYADEGLSRLDTIKSYKGDVSLKTIGKELQQFFKKEGEEKAPVFISYFMTKDNFDKVVKTFQAKPESKRTQADVDQYNKSANEFNEMVNTFNTTNQEQNVKRTALLDKWNKGVAVFLDKHVPKGKK